MLTVDLERVERLVAAGVAGGFELRDRAVLEAAEESTASQTLVVSRASRKLGVACSPFCSAVRKSAT